MRLTVYLGGIIITSVSVSQMTKTTEAFLNEISAKPPDKNYATNKTNVYHIIDSWSMDILDLNDYGPNNKKGY